MYSKEQIINEIKRIAEKLGVQSLKVKDFEINSTIPLSTVKYYLGSWKQALHEAGLESTGTDHEQVKLEKGDDNELLRDLIRIYEKHGETPTLALIQREGKYSERLYTSKWKSVDEAFILAKKRFVKKEKKTANLYRDEEKIAEQNIDDILEEEDIGEQQIENVLDREKTGEVLNREKTEELRKEETVIEDPIGFSAMIDEIEREEKKKAKEKEDEINKEKKRKKDTEVSKKPAKLKDKDKEPEEIDPNEITKVQEIVEIPIKEKPAIDEKKVKKKTTPGKEVDFSDIGLDEVAIAGKIKDEEDKKVKLVQEGDKTKEIKTREPGITHIPQTIQPRKSKKKRKEVDEPINFRGLRHAPLNEGGVLYLFGLISHELGFLIETIKAEFPAGEGKRCFDKKNNRWEHILIDFEYRSSQFKEKGHDENECDLVVCWIHDWEECPVEILELRSTIKYLVNHRRV